MAEYDKLSPHIILFGAESSFTPEYIETARRMGNSIAAGIITGELEWELKGLQVEQIGRISERLLSLPIAVPWVTPGHRFARSRSALDAGFKLSASLIDPSAAVSSTAQLGPGIYVNACATIGSYACLDEGVLINRNASVGHHTHLEKYASLGPGATIASGCRIGKGVMLGAGSIVAPGISIGENSVVTVGAVVTRNAPANCVVAGNPARIARAQTAGYKNVSVI